MQRAMLLARAERLQAEDFLAAEPQPEEVSEEAGEMSFGEGTRSLSEMDQLYIQHVLRETNGNFTQAAQILQIDRKTLRAKLQKPASRESEDRVLRSVP